MLVGPQVYHPSQSSVAKFRITVFRRLLSSDPNDVFLTGLEGLHANLNSTVLSAGGNGTLQDFIRLIKTSDEVTTPFRNLVVVSHAHWSNALWFLPTSSVSETDDMLTYDRLPQIARQLRLDDEYLEPRTSGNKPPRVIFTGCSFGAAEPFLRKLRDLINPRLAAVAPKFYYGIVQKENEPVYFEYMAQPFTEYSIKGLSRAELISRLDTQPPKLDAHGNPIPRGDWEKWVPPEPWKGWNEVPEMNTFLWFSNLELTLPPVVITINNLTFNQDPDRHFRETIAKLKNPNHPLAATHPFPIWVRLGFADANTMLSNMTWKFRYEPERGNTPNRVFGTGSCHRYSLLVMIREPGPGAYESRFPVWNFYQARAGKPFQRTISKLTLPLLPLSAHGPENTKYWNVIEPSS